MRDDNRKDFPLWTGVVMYFPDALLAVSEVSRLGNEQHNPGEPLHWAREKSTDQMNTAIRHMLDHGRGNLKDTDGAWHLAKAIWRLCAELQVAIEANAVPVLVATHQYESENSHAKCCLRTGPETRLVCTRKTGHQGQHEAWGAEKCYEVWVD